MTTSAEQGHGDHHGSWSAPQPACGGPPGHWGPPGHGGPVPGPYGWGPPPVTSTNGLAIASMVLGIIWIYWLGSLLAIVFGHVALSQIKRNPYQTGRGMAIAGLVLGYVGLATLTLVIVLVAVTAGDASAPAPAHDTYYSSSS